MRAGRARQGQRRQLRPRQVLQRVGCRRQRARESKVPTPIVPGQHPTLSSGRVKGWPLSGAHALEQYDSSTYSRPHRTAPHRTHLDACVAQVARQIQRRGAAAEDLCEVRVMENNNLAIRRLLHAGQGQRLVASSRQRPTHTITAHLRGQPTYLSPRHTWEKWAVAEVLFTTSAWPQCNGLRPASGHGQHPKSSNAARCRSAPGRRSLCTPGQAAGPRAHGQLPPAHAALPPCSPPARLRPHPDTIHSTARTRALLPSPSESRAG